MSLHAIESAAHQIYGRQPTLFCTGMYREWKAGIEMSLKSVNTVLQNKYDHIVKYYSQHAQFLK